jgi:hypothetical protein
MISFGQSPGAGELAHHRGFAFLPWPVSLRRTLATKPTLRTTASRSKTRPDYARTPLASPIAPPAIPHVNDGHVRPRRSYCISMPAAATAAALRWISAAMRSRNRMGSSTKISPCVSSGGRAVGDSAAACIIP